MCGLFSAWGNVDEKKFIHALNLQKHRGPDDAGYERFGNLHLGHRRLSIIDLNQSSKQPMSAGNGDLVCVFNGEIYNYREIREQLRTAGYVFRTESDTEVLINAYHLYGEKCLEKFIGMFAFVIFDKRTQSIFAARDRLGVKPLYYARKNGTLYFSSEIKSIVSASGCSTNINLSAISSYLSYRYPIANDSFYDEILQVPPAHYVTVNARKEITLQRYWHFSENIKKQENDRGEEFYLERLRELFSSSVSYRMIADVPVGAYLSGGVDSSAVVAEMSKQGRTPVKTFTIGFEEEGFNEFSYARQVATRYGADHHEIMLAGDDYIESMAELIRLKDAPLGVPNEVPLYRMSQELKKHITVVLSGEGADEIFGGYGRIFRAADDYEKLKKHRAGGSTSASLKEALERKYGNLNFTDEVTHFLHLYRYTDLNLKSAILGKAFSGKDYDHHLDAIFESEFKEVPHEASYATKMMYIFERLHLPGLLQRVDATTMGASVEARVPFVDHRLVEFAFTIPDKYKLKWTRDKNTASDLLSDQISEKFDTPKYILKKAFEGVLDHETLYRKKMGFPVPLNKWFGGKFRDYAASKILSGNLVNEEIINKEYVERLLRSESLAHNHSLAMKVWMLLNLEIFLERI